jgi:hypothetical protein
VEDVALRLVSRSFLDTPEMKDKLLRKISAPVTPQITAKRRPPVISAEISICHP